MPTRATRKGATAAKRASKSPAKKSRASKPQVTEPLNPALPLDNERHERFACEYLKDFNGTQAYIRVYDGVSYDAARANATRLLADAHIRARVEHLAREALAAERVEGAKVLQGMARAAFYDIRKAFNEKGALKPIHELPDEVAFAIAGIEVVESLSGDEDPIPIYTKKVKFNDRIAALGNLGKHFKLFTEKVEVAGPNGGAIPVETKESPEQKAALTAVQQRLAKLERGSSVSK